MPLPHPRPSPKNQSQPRHRRQQQKPLQKWHWRAPLKPLHHQADLRDELIIKHYEFFLAAETAAEENELNDLARLSTKLINITRRYLKKQTPSCRARRGMNRPGYLTASNELGFISSLLLRSQNPLTVPS